MQTQERFVVRDLRSPEGVIFGEVKWHTDAKLVTLEQGFIPQVFESKTVFDSGTELRMQITLPDNAKSRYELQVSGLRLTGADLIEFLKTNNYEELWNFAVLAVVPATCGLLSNQEGALLQWYRENHPEVLDPDYSEPPLAQIEAALTLMGKPQPLIDIVKANSALVGSVREQSAQFTEKESAKKSRVRMTPERLKKVATIYTLNTPDGLKAVGEAFHVSQATAARYIKQAREAGLVEDRRRNKTN